jgi:CheY-like chemotaxis protein
MRILLVEDHQDSANMLALILRGDGHDVLAVGTAGEALRACGEASFDLLISDIGLPDFDGWELLVRLRENCDIPAIALTAFGRHEDRERSRAAGFDAHLPKPVDFKSLTAAVAKYARK